MDRRKLWFAALVSALLAVCALYLSGYLTLMLLKLDMAALRWDTGLRYLQAIDDPGLRPYAWKLKVAAGFGLGLPALVAAALWILALKPTRQSLHGDARFATTGELARHGFLKECDDGIVVGKSNGRVLRLAGQQFAILAAPTRSGKGVGIVIPNLLDYRESMVVLDIKQENFTLTSGWRAAQGHAVYLFNPFAEDRRSHRWNPLAYVSCDPDFRISDLQAIGAMLYPDGADDQKFWVSQARNAFTAFALYLFEDYDDQRGRGTPKALLEFPTLGGIYRVSSGDGNDLKAGFKELSEKPFLSNHARTAFANLVSQAEETFASIMGTFREPLNPFINPVLDAATRENDFLLTDLRRKRMTIYIGIQPNKLAESRLIVNLFFSQVINLNTRELPAADPSLKHQCLLLMDEFTAIGKVDIIAKAVAYMAGYNLRLLPIIQSMAQLEAVYGRETARTLATNHALQILFAPREQQDANDYSEMLGYTTVRRQNVTRGREVSRSESEERRALMLPQELKAMGPDRQVFLYEGIPQPVRCDKIRYYQDRRYRTRLLPAVPVPMLSTTAPTRVGSGSMAGLASMTLALTLLLAACQPSMQPPRQKIEVSRVRPDPDRFPFRLTPNPSQRFDVDISWNESAGPLDRIRVSALYQAQDCERPPLIRDGAPVVPQATVPVENKSMGANEHRAMMFLDAIVDAETPQRGVCHWTFSALYFDLAPSAGPLEGQLFRATLDRRNFMLSSPTVQSFWREGPPGPRAREGLPALTPAQLEDVADEHRDELFTVTMLAEEITPR